MKVSARNVFQGTISAIHPGAVNSEVVVKTAGGDTLVAIVTVGAVATPSGDPLTLLLLSVPLYVLYEATIWIVRFTVRR